MSYQVKFNHEFYWNLTGQKIDYYYARDMVDIIKKTQYLKPIFNQVSARVKTIVGDKDLAKNNFLEYIKKTVPKDRKFFVLPKQAELLCESDISNEIKNRAYVVMPVFHSNTGKHVGWSNLVKMIPILKKN